MCEAPPADHRVTAVCRIIGIAGGLPGQVENHPDRCVMGQTQGGEILVSDVVWLVEGNEYVFSKGFDEAVRLFEVRLSGKSDGAVRTVP
jgi:hypothetical protein